MKPLRLLITLFGMFLWTACAPVISVSPTAAPGQPLETSPAAPTAVTAAASTPSPNPSAAPVVEQSSGALWVRIYAADMQVVSQSEFLLRGEAPIGTVLSINEQDLVTEDNGAFSTVLTLEEGPNLLEIVASNSEGQQVTFTLVLIYEPES